MISIFGELCETMRDPTFLSPPCSNPRALLPRRGDGLVLADAAVSVVPGGCTGGESRRGVHPHHEEDKPVLDCK